ncbi:MAG: hypothetical protein GY714_10530 [Desulfobacterales bacterium]|nr:hypothetical protein [Desulfobacterales bacterium]
MVETERIKKLKSSLLEFLNGRGQQHYTELTPLERSIVDLVQALYTKLDQLALKEEVKISPADKLTNSLLEAVTRLQGGKVTADIADDFSEVLKLLDQSADLSRQSKTLKDRAETEAFGQKSRSSQ